MKRLLVGLLITVVALAVLLFALVIGPDLLWLMQRWLR